MIQGDASEPKGRMFYYYRQDEDYEKQHILITSREQDTIETITESLAKQHGTKVVVKSK